MRAMILASALVLGLLAPAAAVALPELPRETSVHTETPHMARDQARAHRKRNDKDSKTPDMHAEGGTTHCAGKLTKFGCGHLATGRSHLLMPPKAPPSAHP